MKRTDMWGEPTINGKLRSGFKGARVAAGEAPLGFSGFADLAGIDRPVLERFLKKSIPILIIAFLIAVALARGLSMLSSHGRMEDAVRQETALSAALALKALGDKPDLFEPGAGTAAADALRDLTSLTVADPDADLMIIDTDGLVLAATGASQALEGRTLASVFPGLASAHRIRSQASVSETRIDGASYLVSMYLAGDKGGMVVALHAMTRMNALWRAEVNLNVTLFAAMALLLLVVVYAYYGQLNRADSTAGQMGEERQLRETMLANGDAGLWTYDAATRAVVLDGSSCAVLGLGSAARTIGYRTLLALVHPSERIGLARSLRPSDDGLIEASVRLAQPDGRYALFEVRAHAASRGGRLIVSGAAIRAARGHARALDAATERTARLQAAIDALPQALALWHADGRLDTANRSFRNAYALDGSARNIRREDVAAEQDTPSVVIRRANAGARTVSEVRTASGGWLQLCESETATGARITVGTDITRFKDDQNRLQAEQERLREKINELAASRRSLQRKCAMMTRKLDEKGYGSGTRTFALADCGDLNVPAEIRTALTAVLGFSELMIAEVGKPGLAEHKLGDYARSVHEGGSELNLLVERLENTGAPAATQCGGIIRRTVA